MMRDEWQVGRTVVRTSLTCAMVICLAFCVGCTQVKVDEESPRVMDVHLSSTSSMTELSQDVQIKLVFDRPISVVEGVADDFEVLLNDAPVDGTAMVRDVRASADSVTFVLRSASSAEDGGKGSFFALYQAGFSVASVRTDGVLPSITGASGSCAVLDVPITGTLPSGLAIEALATRAGSVTASVPAQTTIRVASPALVRAITWFSPDGGTTKLLKHNHTFADADAKDCAADLAKVVNEASGLGITAMARGDEITLTATTVQDGQTIDPIVVEGVGVTGGEYDPSLGMGEG